MNNPSESFAKLMAVIEERKADPPPRSYTTSLFAAGVEKIGGKIMEEAQEVVDAAREVDQAKTEMGKAHLTHEAADLIYHLFVMMGHLGVSLDDVGTELEKRSGTSGLDEKAARRTSTS